MQEDPVTGGPLPNQRCPWCNELWVYHQGEPVVVPQLCARWWYRPNCECYSEHTEHFVNVRGTLRRVILLEEHRPPWTAKQIRAEERASRQVSQEAQGWLSKAQ